jgi:hypothetical protein
VDQHPWAYFFSGLDDVKAKKLGQKNVASGICTPLTPENRIRVIRGFLRLFCLRPKAALGFIGGSIFLALFLHFICDSLQAHARQAKRTQFWAAPHCVTLADDKPHEETERIHPCHVRHCLKVHCPVFLCAGERFATFMISASGC